MCIFVFFQLLYYPKMYEKLFNFFKNVSIDLSGGLLSKYILNKALFLFTPFGGGIEKHNFLFFKIHFFFKCVVGMFFNLLFMTHILHIFRHR